MGSRLTPMGSMGYGFTDPYGFTPCQGLTPMGLLYGFTPMGLLLLPGLMPARDTLCGGRIATVVYMKKPVSARWLKQVSVRWLVRR